DVRLLLRRVLAELGGGDRLAQVRRRDPPVAAVRRPGAAALDGQVPRDEALADDDLGAVARAAAALRALDERGVLLVAVLRQLEPGRAREPAVLADVQAVVGGRGAGVGADADVAGDLLLDPTLLEVERDGVEARRRPLDGGVGVRELDAAGEVG